MADPDLKLAILLQKQFDDESHVDNHDDTLLATHLQEEFNHEYKSETGMGLAYKTNKGAIKHGGKSLVDPSWELVDPTPNIHNLFVVFNERFFWNSLQMVCVSWSKRMTLCAGVCSYQGRRGLCHITLSEPLLKLRPRKDLVETLLHEMIHAYLFVTNNNRDRDGHGPEFHKHMHRINGEAGTNITVYHDFHDEVELYKQHWWKCNGPCQQQKPYFGVVKRAINRAPGPNDFWWSEHQSRCGGIFTKIHEPEKKKPQQQKSINKTSSIPNYDITKYITTTSINSPMKSPKKSIKPNKPIVSPNRDIRSFFIPTKSKEISKPINTIKNKNGFNVETGAVFNKGNIHGFKNLGTNNSSKVSKNLNDTSFKGIVAVKSNNSNTVVVTGKQPSNLSKSKENILKNNVQVFSGTSKTLSSTPTKTSQDCYNKVRDTWAKKYDNNNLLSNKRPASEDEITSIQNKRHQKTQIVLINDDIPSNLVTCPICNKKISSSIIEKHVDECLIKQFKDDEPVEKQETCCVCNKKVPKSIYKEHIVDCFNTSYDNGLDELIECVICESFFDKTMIETHTIDCIEKNSKVDIQHTNKNNKVDKNNDLMKCNVCLELVESLKYNLHVEKCLHKMLDDIEDEYDIPTTNTKVNCLVCRKEIFKSDLNAHLDECMSGVFDEKFPDGTPKEVEKENFNPSSSKDDDFMYSCPFCLDLYSELDMSGHLDECVKIGKENSPEKSILIDSFSSDDF
nr:sprT-like domain-containing protein Spartan [Onthophagus taurus]XP_022916075.1 sprT-like domain-containing protein Spartan [Onthophagus taurus]